MSAHQRVTVAENYFYNQVDTMTHSVGEVSYFPSPSCPCLVGSLTHGCGSRNGGYA